MSPEFPEVVFDREALALLTAYGWPGNVRELENTVERLLIMRNGDTIAAARFLRIPRHTLIYRMEKYGIVPPEKR